MLYVALHLKLINFAVGELPEWSNGAVSKTVVPLCGTKGSNPLLSAKQIPQLK